jgi:hypothetical protein
MSKPPKPPSVNVDVAYMPVKARLVTRKLKATWSAESAKDLQAYYNPGVLEDLMNISVSIPKGLLENKDFIKGKLYDAVPMGKHKHNIASMLFLGFERRTPDPDSFSGNSPNYMLYFLVGDVAKVFYCEAYTSALQRFERVK